MKCHFILTISVLVSATLSLSAQKKQQTAFAITSAAKGAFNWTAIKLIDLSTGEVIQSIYDNNGSSLQAFNARSKKEIPIKDAQGKIGDQNALPLSTFSAACAYDAKHNRVYYALMSNSELRYIDLNESSPRIYSFEGESLSTATNLADEANHITRMVIAADGQGYGLSNDGNHLVRFTTGRKPVITDLGPLQDDAANGSISIHTKATSWGGDMIADASGNLYVISAPRAVFRVDLTNRTATYVNTISGLPADYTTNGAAIAADGKLVVSSASSTDGYYQVDMSNWQAQKINSNGQVFNTSDLANSNLAFADKPQQDIELINRAIIRNANISVYPNPVSEGIFRVSFNTKLNGRYDIQLVDLTGRVLTQRAVSVGNEGQVEEVPVRSGIATGTYFVKVLNNSKKIVYADKVLVTN